jgi:hypothetical protein
MKLRLYGIDGHASIAIDRQTARYAERLTAGPASFAQGYDGTHAWQADATGMSAVQGNATQRGTVLALGYMLAFPPPGAHHRYVGALCGRPAIVDRRNGSCNGAGAALLRLGRLPRANRALWRRSAYERRYRRTTLDCRLRRKRRVERDRHASQNSGDDSRRRVCSTTTTPRRVDIGRRYLDYRANLVSFSTALRRDWTEGTPATPFVYDSRQPQVDGSIDSFPGAMTIDTGNSGVLDVNSPFAYRYGLWAFYRATKPRNGSLAGVGGSVATSDVTVRSFRLGSARLSDVQADLSRASAGAESDPAVAANVGEGIFRNFTFLLDYPNQQLYFAPGGLRDALGILFTRRGDRIVVTKVRSARARAAGVREGMTLTSVDGTSVGAHDLPALEPAFEAPFGKRVHLVFNQKTTVTQTLTPYL